MINIIAEIGANHDGSTALAKEMINAAAENGANYVKFQSWKEEDLRKGPWDEDTGPFFHYKNKRDFYKAAELLENQHYELIEYSKKQNVKFLTTCFARDRVDFLSKLGLDSIKVAGCDSVSKSMINDLSKVFKKLIVSTGMTTNEEITPLSKQLHELENDFVLMHCVSMYPTPIEKVSLSRMNFIKEAATKNPDNNWEACEPPSRGEFGISDHSLGINVPIASITHGATWIEKHFTTDKDLPGPDNKMSINPSELKSIRNFADDYEIMVNNKSEDVYPEEINLREMLYGRFGDNS